MKHLATRGASRAGTARTLAPLAAKLIILPEEPTGRAPSTGCTRSCSRDGGEAERDAVMRQLDAEGIETRPVFYPMHIQPPHRDDAHAYPHADAGRRAGYQPADPRAG